MVRGNQSEREAFEQTEEKYERGETSREPAIDAENLKAPVTWGSVN